MSRMVTKFVLSLSRRVVHAVESRGAGRDADARVQLTSRSHEAEARQRVVPLERRAREPPLQSRTTAVVASTSWLCSDKLTRHRPLRRFHARWISSITRKPSPPTTMRPMITPSVIGDVWKPMTLSENVENPALQNALMAWNIACPTALSPRSGSQAMNSTRAPTASSARVKRTTWRTRLRKSTSGATSALLALTRSW